MILQNFMLRMIWGLLPARGSWTRQRGEASENLADEAPPRHALFSWENGLFRSPSENLAVPSLPTVGFSCSYLPDGRKLTYLRLEAP